MKITQIKFQKIAVKSAILMAVVALFYALAIFATPFKSFEAVQSFAGIVDDGNALGSFPAQVVQTWTIDTTGYDMYNIDSEITMQRFNETFFTLTLIYFLVSLTLLIFFTQSRRKYYISNIISSICVAVFGIFISVFSIANIIKFRTMFVNIDFASFNENPYWIESGKTAISSSTWSFDIGIIAFVLVAITSILLIVNLLWKKKAMADDAKKYAKIDAKIFDKWEKHEIELQEEAEKYEG